MNNALSIAWRTPCPGIRTTSSTPFCAPPVTLLRSLLFSGSRNVALQPGRGLHSRSNAFNKNPYWRRNNGLLRPSQQSKLRWFNSSSQSCHPVRPTARKPRARETGVEFRKEPLSDREISEAFSGARISTTLGNRVLRVLQGRRIRGTLDLNLPVDIRNTVPQATIDRGLEWLRKNYPVDEDAAIMARVEREEAEDEEAFLRRAEELGIFRPQSGHYGEWITKEGDVYGRSRLEETRKANEAKEKIREEKEREEWLAGEGKDMEKGKKLLAADTSLQKYVPPKLLEAEPRADPREKPVLAWVQQHRVRATNYDIDPSKLTQTNRLLPSLAVVLLTVAGCYIFSETYEPPKRHERMWRDIPPTAATILAMMASNLLIFTCWRVLPPAWRMLNRYFISVPMYPYPLSTLGSIFSHQEFEHLASNMIALWFLGTRIHEEIGRGDFLALYMSTGVIASFTSLASNVLRNRWHVSSLGASGAISGIIAAWCVLHFNDKLTIAFLPQSWQEIFSASGGFFLVSLFLLEVIGMRSRLPAKLKIDYWCHLGGLVSGAGAGWLLKEKAKRQREKRRNEESIWERIWGNAFGRESK